MSRTRGLVVQELNRELLIYDLITSKAYCLNETSSLVWQTCDGHKSVAQISKEISDQLGIKHFDDRVVWLALDQLKKENLMAEGDKLEIDFNGLSRREMIKQIGLTSAVALPLISSIVAPAVVEAASLSGTGAACSTNTTCQSGTCRGGLCCAQSTGTLNPQGFRIQCTGDSRLCTSSGYAAPYCCSGTASYTATDTFCNALNPSQGACVCN